MLGGGVEDRRVEWMKRVRKNNWVEEQWILPQEKERK
jgi:hypothetical protein